VSGWTKRRLLIAAALGLLVVAAAAVFVATRDRQRSDLLLLTSLPIVFPEEFTLEGGGSPALAALERHYVVTPISLADRQSLGSHKLLLMAQPQAQPGEALVELDEWVRGGGRVLLLADPALEWPSDRPLGDVLRPPLAFGDTGLLGHWGLRLDPPASFAVTNVSVDGRTIRTAGPGTLTATGPGCTVAENRLVGRCRIGQGEATVVSDADFLDSDRFGGANLDLLTDELDRLRH
jgi:hypothetical protein